MTAVIKLAGLFGELLGAVAADYRASGQVDPDDYKARFEAALGECAAEAAGREKLWAAYAKMSMAAGMARGVVDGVHAAEKCDLGDALVDLDTQTRAADQVVGAIIPLSPAGA
jgi:hypothetical protein